MPYASNKDLPDAVKNTLPEAAQTVYRNAFNSSLAKDKDEELAAKVGWTAVKNGWTKKGDNWIKNNTELKDIEIFSVGIHKGEEFTEADLDAMVNNFAVLKQYIKPALKLAHQNNMHKKDGQPALGWASEIKRVGKKLLATFTDVPELVRQAISKRLYSRVSSEIYSGLNIGGKTYKRVLAGVGILGADIPEVKDLKDIEIFFADNNQFTIDHAITTYTMDVDSGIITTEVDTMSDELKKSFEERLKLIEQTHAAELKKFTEQQEQALKSFSEEKDKILAEKNREIEELKAANLKRESENKIATFKTFCEDMVKAGKMVPAARDILVADIDKMEFSEGENFTISFDKFKTYTEKTAEILDKTEHGFYVPKDKREKSTVKTYSGKSGAVFENTDLDEKALAYAREHKVDYAEAMAIVLESDPKLAEQFTEAGFDMRREG